MNVNPAAPSQSTHVVIRTDAEIDHPHLNVWVLRGQLHSDIDGNLHLLPNLQETFQGLAQATSEVEDGENGTSAQVYRLVSAELQTPPRSARPRRPHAGA